MESPYQCKMLLCNHHHMKSPEESTYTPAILSPHSKDRKSATLSTRISTEKIYLKPLYQMWMQLVQRLHDRTTALKPVIQVDCQSNSDKGLQREKSWSGRETNSSYNKGKLNSSRQVQKLINHYSKMLTIDNNERFGSSFTDRRKSILRPRGSNSNYRLTKEVTFATN